MMGTKYYLSHVSSRDGKAESMALSSYEAIKSAKLEKNLLVIGSDGTAVMTGKSAK